VNTSSGRHPHSHHARPQGAHFRSALRFHKPKVTCSPSRANLTSKDFNLGTKGQCTLFQVDLNSRLVRLHQGRPRIATAPRSSSASRTCMHRLFCFRSTTANPSSGILIIMISPDPDASCSECSMGLAFPRRQVYINLQTLSINTGARGGNAIDGVEAALRTLMFTNVSSSYQFYLCAINRGIPTRKHPWESIYLVRSMIELTTAFRRGKIMPVSNVKI
jgi:hypothetical protein